jgi:hypothetical protein
MSNEAYLRIDCISRDLCIRRRLRREASAGGKTSGRRGWDELTRDCVASPAVQPYGITLGAA